MTVPCKEQDGVADGSEFHCEWVFRMNRFRGVTAQAKVTRQSNHATSRLCTHTFISYNLPKAGRQEKVLFIMAKGLFASLKGVDAFGKVCYISVFWRAITNIIILDDRRCESQNSNRRSLWVTSLA